MEKYVALGKRNKDKSWTVLDVFNFYNDLYEFDIHDYDGYDQYTCIKLKYLHNYNINDMSKALNDIDDNVFNVFERKIVEKVMC